MYKRRIFILVVFLVIAFVVHFSPLLNIRKSYDPTSAYAYSAYTPDLLGRYFSAFGSYKTYDKKIIPGGLVALLLQDDNFHQMNIKEVRASLMDGEQEKYSVAFLKYTENEYYALFPIPSNVSEGKYKVYISYEYKTDNVSHGVVRPVNSSFDINIGDRNFYKEEVKLNRNLAKRKASPANPKVIKEAEEIWAITGTINKLSRYELGNFIFPVEDYKYVTGMFADRRVYTYLDGNVISGVAHGGIDIAAHVGTPVFAGGTGKVIMAKSRIVTGKSVVIEHYPGVYSMYYHLNSIDVNKGDIIMKGTKLGTVGNTGFSTGPHLHWEMRANNIRVDPLLSMEALDNIKAIDILYK